MAWFYVLMAGIVEVMWVIGLRYSSNFWECSLTVIAIIFSFYFVIKACSKIPSGTVYAVFTGMGATGIVLLDFLILGADFSLIKLVFLCLIIIGVIGIKLTTKEKLN